MQVFQMCEQFLLGRHQYLLWRKESDTTEGYIRNVEIAEEFDLEFLRGVRIFVSELISQFSWVSRQCAPLKHSEV